ncbi:methyltransferase domain-containing protein [Miniphocaeibacter halophilus]|uniref:Methyltransferase domain-containing protein n=1 Tax=Miniphocaeibacter halophilus TaxID=2931922 RepID=A0AC61MS31_9FIRM|nr:methyltransferase domain-containing protein [Miniphocaeibacter halophilus]QQK08424.1 methyltransferase domain-containing protein [Miniphocaeibacter halophilus]
MAEWNSKQYLKFEEYRTQPARDLTNRLLKYNPNTILDIGCGPGNSTAVLKEAFPNAYIKGIDSSENMIEKAKRTYPNIDFEICDISNIKNKYDLIFSNACIQWVPDHDVLIPKLMNNIEENGILAIQIPINNSEPLYKIVDEIVLDPKWNFNHNKIHKIRALEYEEYFNILSKCSSDFEIWITKYLHRMASHKDLIDWVKGTSLRPYLDELSEEKGKELESEILNQVEKVYSLMDNGEVIQGFKRLFFIAKK